MAQSSSLDRPAIHGGRPAFPGGLPFVRPSLPEVDEVASDVRGILASGMLTNARFVRLLEQRSAAYLNVRHCIAVSSCTAGLMLVLRAARLSGDVVVPSFTFAATAHAVAWNGLRPVFADVRPDTLTLDPDSVARSVGVRTSAILATHIFGTPCDVEDLQEISRLDGVRLFFDAAHAFGSLHRGHHVGIFGDAEVFSLSPTKVMVACEGGIIATNDDLLAERCRIGRDYANPGDYDCQFVGLNARMSEIHAAVALRSLEGLDDRIEWRNQLVSLYRDRLGSLPGLSFARVPEGDLSTYKDFTILIEPDEFGLTARDLAGALEPEGIETKRYYAPPVHTMKAYRALPHTSANLDVTEWAVERVLTLPLWSSMTEDQVTTVAAAVDRIRTALAGETAARATAEKVRRASDAGDVVVHLP